MKKLLLILLSFFFAAWGSPAEDGPAEATLTFSSFDGGGPAYTVTIGDPDLLQCVRSVEYRDANHQELDGARYDVTFTFTGLKAGATQVTVASQSPIAGHWLYTYWAEVDNGLNVTLTLLTEEDMDAFVCPTPTLVIEANGCVFYADLEDNSSAEALIGLLESGGLTLDMHDYGGFEKVGDLPWALPQNDEKITARPGDVILYQGSQITVYYGENTWDFTRLARIGNVTGQDLKEAFGDGDVTVSFQLEWSE